MTAVAKSGRVQMYKQCTLRKPVDGGTAWMVSWIRSQIAVVGNALAGLEDAETGVIETGWLVHDVSEPAMPEHLLIRQAHNYDRMRLKSDI
jgi:hypothetical protein